MSVADRLQLLRLKAGLSQSQLADAAGLSVRSLQQWEQGKRVPKTLAVLALARALGVEVEQLLGTAGNRPGRPGGKRPAPGPTEATARPKRKPRGSEGKGAKEQKR